MLTQKDKQIIFQTCLKCVSEKVSNVELIFEEAKVLFDKVTKYMENL